MRILFITPFNIFPPYWGGGQRTYHLVKHLAKDHRVYLIFPPFLQFKHKNPEPYQKELKKLGVELRVIGNWPKWQIIEFLNPFFLLKSFDLILSKKIDLIICDYPWSGFYALITHMFTFRSYIFLEHNIEYEIKEQTRSRYVWLMKLLEIILSKSAKRVIVTSDKDRNKLVSLGINKRKVLVLENGFDSDRFIPSRKLNKKIRKRLGIENNPMIFFCGKFDYAPNVEALHTIRWKILPNVLQRIPDAKFVVTGGGQSFIDPSLNHPSLIFTGVIDDIENYLNAADVVIIPLTKGGGTRIKILEAIACGKTIVTTTKGAEGLVNELTKPFLKIADDWDTFSDYICKALSNSKSRKVPRKFIERYSWKNIYKKVDEILEELA